MSQPDVLVIGGGIIGAAIAWELARSGVQVTVLDAGDVGTGATGAALGVLVGVSSQVNGGVAAALRLRSWTLFEPLIERLESDLGRSLPVNRHGLLHLLTAAADYERWQPTLVARQAAGYTLEYLPPSSLAPRYPLLSGNTFGAVYSPQDRQINPRLLTQSLVVAAQSYGAEFRWHTPVERWEHQGSRITQIHTAQGSLRAAHIVLAAGQGSQVLAGIPMHGVKGQAIKVYAPQVNFHPVITGADLHLVPLSEGCLWIGATVEFQPDRPEPTVDTIPALIQRATALCPALATARVQEHWAGMRPRPQGQRAPILGFSPHWENLIVATGHYRNGVLLAPISAAVVKDLLLRGETPHCRWQDFAPPV